MEVDASASSGNDELKTATAGGKGSGAAAATTTAARQAPSRLRISSRSTSGAAAAAAAAALAQPPAPAADAAPSRGRRRLPQRASRPASLREEAMTIVLSSGEESAGGEEEGKKEKEEEVEPDVITSGSDSEDESFRADGSGEEAEDEDDDEDDNDEEEEDAASSSSSSGAEAVPAPRGRGRSGGRGRGRRWTRDELRAHFQSLRDRRDASRAEAAAARQAARAAAAVSNARVADGEAEGDPGRVWDPAGGGDAAAAAEAFEDEDADVAPDPLVRKQLPAAPQPPEVVTPLLDYQLEFLSWAMAQESTACGSVGGGETRRRRRVRFPAFHFHQFGRKRIAHFLFPSRHQQPLNSTGILADEMGLGKTLQSIALIVVGRDERRVREREEAELGAAGTARRSAAAAGVAAREAAAAAAASGASHRPTLRMLSAPVPFAADYDDGGAASAAADLRADLAATKAAKAKEAAAKASASAAQAAPLARSVAAAPLTLEACVTEVTRSSMAAREPYGPRPEGLGEGGCSSGGGGGGGGGGCSHSHAKASASAASASAAGDEENSFSSATLVICPLVAVLQWKTEAERHVRPGVLQTIVHHGQRRATCPRELEKADIVLTTYSTLESDFRRASAATAERVRCGQCAKWYSEEALVQHLAYFCHESNDAARTAKQALAVRKRPRGGGGDGGKGGKASKTSKSVAPAKDPKGKGKARGSKGARSDSDSGSEFEADWSSSSSDDEDYGKKKKKKNAPNGAKKERGDGAGPSSPARPLSAAALEAKERRLASLTFRDFDDGALSDPEPPPSSSKDPYVLLMGGASSSAGPNAAARAKGWPSRHHLRAARMAKLHRLIIARAGPPPTSVLHAVRWRRVVLDEAHAIKDRTSSTARACFALEARSRWCLSGTPLQNRVGELYSLLRFLRAYPFAYYFCKAGMVSSSCVIFVSCDREKEESNKAKASGEKRRKENSLKRG